jgi:hypothetical protein
MVQFSWLSFGGVMQVRGAGLVLGVLVALVAAPALWAGPFSEVPSDDWAYPVCARLVGLDVLSSAGGSMSFSGRPQLTRFEFGIALLEPLTALQREMASLPAGADPVVRAHAATRALRLSPQLSEDQIAAVAGDLRRLAAEFADVLRPLGFDPASVARELEALSNSEALREWRSQALASPTGVPALTTVAPPDNTVRLPLARGALAFTYQPDLRPPGLLDYLALSAADTNPGPASTSAYAEASPRDPRVSRLRTAYEYDLTTALTLSLAYEEIARRGQGLSPLDTAYLASLGVGYRFAPSASVKLSYSLLEYSSYVFDTPKVRDHVAETAVTIEF